MSSLLISPSEHKPRSLGVDTSRVGSSRPTKVTLKAIEYYDTHVPEDDEVAMSALEDEVRLSCEFKEDSEVDFQVGRVISDLGCTSTRNSKFFHTLEIYWHVKMMVSFGMFPKDKDIHQLKGRMEMLKI
jgi:hypothetical protein